MSATVFEETQKISASIILLMTGLFVAICGVIAVVSSLAELKAGLPYILGPTLLAVALLWTMKMRTHVDEQGIRIRLLYIVRRRIEFKEIANAEAVTYRPLRDYGGWGVRLGPKGKTYNMRGDRGVQLTLTNGGRVLIGSQRADELCRIIQDKMVASI